MPKIEKPEMLTLVLMRGPRDKLKTITAKLKGGLVEYNGMDPNEPIVYYGSPSYTLFNVQSRKVELFYDITAKRLLKLNELGGQQQTDAIADLTRNFTIATKATMQNTGADDPVNNTGKWVLGILVVVAIVAMVFIYLMATHVPATSAAPQASANVLQAASHGIIPINGT